MQEHPIIKAKDVSPKINSKRIALTRQAKTSIRLKNSLSPSHSSLADASGFQIPPKYAMDIERRAKVQKER
ncbi:MAG: hypothetical protein Q3M30_00605 [Candidatus Electrothrix sp. Rat3]|nr:hypothetical protein [Candidatus Electrothrix rattekaaiensis]